MSGYNFNLYDPSEGNGIPDQGANGLPLVFASANLPTQAVSDSPIQRSTSLDYSPHEVESNFHTPATTLPVRDVQYARVAASGERVKQNFTAQPQPKSPSLWRSVVNAVVGGKIGTGSSYSASGNYTTQGGAGGAGGITTPQAGGGDGGGMKTVQPVTAGGNSTR